MERDIEGREFGLSSIWPFYGSDSLAFGGRAILWLWVGSLWLIRLLKGWKVYFFSSHGGYPLGGFLFPWEFSPQEP